MRSRALPLVALLGLVHLGAAPSPLPSPVVVPSTAAPSPPPSVVPRAVVGTRIDPAIKSLFGLRRLTGTTPPWYLPYERFDREGVVPVVVRFATAPTASELSALGRAGVEWDVPLASGAFAAKIVEPALAALEVDANVARVSCDMPRNAPLALDASANETGIAAARRALRRKDGKLLDGKGTKIADIDSGIFVFHPSFFHADGGVYAWVDVDGDGKLTPNVDGVDLDGNGTVDDNERLKELRVEAPKRPAKLDPSMDYLYVDANNNGQRDFGRDFGEAAPAFGEPIFVIDDVDGDGVLAPSEKLLRLKTSKIAAVRETRTYTRGHATSGLVTYGAQLLRDARRLDYSSHGTGVGSILVGGVPDRSKHLGLAPGADLLAAGYGGYDPGGTTASVQWAIDQKADVILTEYAPYTGYPLDGSSEEELLLDAAVDKGIAVVNPAGNLSLGHKHDSLALNAGANVVVMKTDAAFSNGPLVGFTLLHRGDARALKLELSFPDGTKVPIPETAEGDPTPIGKGRILDVVRRTSARGTHEIHVNVYAYEAGKYGSLPSGKYEIAIDSDAAFRAEIYVHDAYNSWARGLVLERNTPSRTLCHPATNDKGITVAAYTLHGDDPFGGGDPGALAWYSSAGPRIDGVVGMDIAAPDNPFAAGVPDSGSVFAVPISQFGGTSGAGPHVAAAAALLKQLDPTLSGATLQARLLDKARRDSFVTSDATRWGKGKLDVAAALGIVRKEGKPPVVKLVAPDKPQATRPIELRVEAEDDGGNLKARWDLEYDGTPDGDWEPLGAKTLKVDAPTTRWVRVDVMDEDGYVRGATAKLQIGEPIEEPPPSPAADGSNASSGGCGCTTTPSRTPGGTILVALAAMAVLRRRR